MSTLGERLRLVRGAMTREEAGRRLDIHPNTLMKYEGDNRVPDADFVVKFCREFDISEVWLLRELGDPPKRHGAMTDVMRSFEDAKTDLLPVPFFETRAGAGAQQVGSDDAPTKYINLPRELFLLRGIKPKSSRLILASGSSMEPTLSDGDLLLVDCAVEGRSDGIFIIRRDGGVLIKRLQWLSDGALAMISDNKAYAEERLPRDDADDLKIVGRVRMVFKSV